MQTVTDDTGRRYLRLDAAGESSLLLDPETGEETYVANERLTPVDRSPLETAAAGLPADARRLLAGIHDERGLGLVLELDRRGAVSVRALLSSYDLCESDLHGLLGELSAAGVIEEIEVAGERGYRVAEGVGESLDALREIDEE